MDLPEAEPLSRRAPEEELHLGILVRIEQTTQGVNKPRAWPESIPSLKFHSRTTDGRKPGGRNVCHKILISASALRPQAQSAGTMEHPLSWRTHGLTVRQASFLALFVATLFICAGCSSNKRTTTASASRTSRCHGHSERRSHTSGMGLERWPAMWTRISGPRLRRICYSPVSTQRAPTWRRAKRCFNSISAKRKLR